MDHCSQSRSYSSCPAVEFSEDAFTRDVSDSMKRYLSSNCQVASGLDRFFAVASLYERLEITSYGPSSHDIGVPIRLSETVLKPLRS